MIGGRWIDTTFQPGCGLERFNSETSFETLASMGRQSFRARDRVSDAFALLY